MVAAVTSWTPTGNAVLDAAGQLSKSLYVNKVAVAQYYGEKNGTIAGATSILVGVTADPATVTAAKASVDVAVVAGSTFTLTTGADNIAGTSGNDAVSAVISATTGESTLNLADVVDGGAGTDSLNLIVSGNVGLPAAAISNVEKFFVKNLTGATTAHDFASVTGETEVWVNASTVATAFTNLDKAAIGVKDVTGGTLTHTFTFKDAAFASTAALDIALSNAGNVVTGNAQTIDIRATGAVGAANAVNIAAEGKNLVTLASGGSDIAAAAGIKTLTITGTGSLSLTAGSDAGGGALATNLTTVNLAGNSGGVSMQVDKTTVKVTGGSGADVISVGGAMTVGAEFKLGAGNDQLLAANTTGKIDKNVVVDGGDGIDTLSNGLITVDNGAIFKNFEKIALDAAVTTDVELLTGSTISSLLINGNVAASVTNVASGAIIDVTSTASASDVTVGVKGAAASTTDKLTVNFTGVAQAATPTSANIKAGSLVADKVETIDVVSGGADNTWNALAIKADSALKTMSITGAKNLDLTFTGTNGTNIGTGLGGAVKSIDGSAASGKLNITLTNVVYDDKDGFTLKGGTGNDTITTNASSATLTGTGGNDKYVVTTTAAGTTDATTAKITTITDFNSGDSIALTTLSSITKTQTQIGTAQNLTEAIDLALKAGTAADGAASWFNYGGNTYVVVDTASATNGFSTDDVIVKLTGTLDLTNAVLDTNVLTLA